MNKFILLISLISLKFTLISQFQLTVNQNTPISPDNVVGSVVGSDNSVYLCFNDANYSATNDVVVVKFSECGDTIWSKVYNSGQNDYAKKILIDANDNIYIGGNYGTKPFARKYDANGNVIYTNQISITQGADINDIALSSSGELYMAGRIPTSSQGYDTYLVKINTLGTSAYTRTYNTGGTNNDYIYRIGLGTNYIYGFGEGGTSNIAVMYDLSGNFQWANTSITHVPQSVIIDASNNAYFGNNNYIAKITPSNTISWNLFAPFQYINNGSMTDIILFNGDLYATGYTTQSTGTKKRMHTIKMNTATGNRTWINHYVNTSGDEEQADDMGMRIYKTGIDTITVVGILNSGIANAEFVGLIQYNTNGNVLTTETILSSGNTYISSCQGKKDDFFIFYGGFKFARFVDVPSSFALTTYYDNFFCSVDDSTQLVGSVPLGSTFSWSPTTYINDTTILNPYVKWNTFGNKTFTLNLNQCDGSKSVLVERKITPGKTVRVDGVSFNSNSTINICANDSLKLTGINLTDSYTWLKVGDPSFIEILYGMDTLIVDEPGIYYADINTAYCSNTTVMITVNQDDDIINIGNDTSICSGNSLTIDASGNGYQSYTWSTGEITSSINTDTAGIYTLNVVQIGGCPATGSLQLSIDTIPNINLNSSYDVCIGDSLVLNAGSNMSSYNWGGMSFNQTYTYYGGSANFVLYITDGNGCQNNKYIGISDLNLPSLELGNDTVICFGQNVFLSASPGMDSYLWSTSDTTQNITVSLEGNYSVEITSTNGCKNSDTLFVDTIVCNTTNLTNLTTESFSIYPNPSDGEFNYYSQNNIKSIYVIDASGRELYYINKPKNKGVISIDNLNQGIYFVKFITLNNNAIIKRLIIN